MNSKHKKILGGILGKIPIHRKRRKEREDEHVHIGHGLNKNDPKWLIANNGKAVNRTPVIAGNDSGSSITNGGSLSRGNHFGSLKFGKHKKSKFS